jgi:hypothetical protein
MLSAIFAKTFALFQLFSLVYLFPQYVLRPHWNWILSVLGGPVQANVIGVPLLHLLVLLLGNALFAILYYGSFQQIETYRISKNDWLFKGTIEQKQEFWRLVRSSIGLTLFNVILTIPLSYSNYSLSVFFGHNADLDKFPSTLSIALHMLLFIALEDILFYIGHRTLHSIPFLYLNVHKLHHRWVQQVSIAAEATHPIEFVLSNVIPFAAGPLLSGAHLSLLYIWTIYRVFETISHHSGYELPTDMFAIFSMQGDTLAHDLHHSKGGGLSNRSGNYGSMSQFWDYLFNTQLSTQDIKDKSSSLSSNIETTKRKSL